MRASWLKSTPEPDEESRILTYPRLTKCMPDETRHNPFQALHKALRHGHCRMLPELGAGDFGDDAASGGLLLRLVQHLDLCRAVAEARQQALLGAAAAHGLEADSAACQDHAGHMAALAELQSLVRAVNVAAAKRRRPAGRSIYRCYALYASSDMARMDEDETLLLTRLHDGLADAELRALEGRTYAALAPEHFQALMRLLLPALSTSELEVLLDLLEAHMEPSYFASSVEPAMRPLLASSRVVAA
jgi:hypothetical protein